MKIFKLNNIYSIVCTWSSRRGGFKHTATLMQNGHEIDSAKCTYVNRTWERFEYQSVLRHLLGQTLELTDKEKKRFIKKVC